MRLPHLRFALITGLILGGLASVGYGYPLSVSATQWDFADATVPSTFYIDLNVPDQPATGATGLLTIEACGDLNGTNEYLTVTIEWSGGSGIIFNGDTTDDGAFTSVPGDMAGYYTVNNRKATLSASKLSTLTADNVVSITVQKTGTINDDQDDPDDFVRATIEYEAMPEPAMLAMAVLGGLAILRRPRRS